MDRERQRLVHRYIDGLASLPERREVERYMAADPALAAYVRRHAAVWARVGAMPDTIANADPDAALESLAARITGDRAAPQPSGGHAFGSSRRLRVIPAQPPPPRRRAVDWSTMLAFGVTAAAVAIIAVAGRNRHSSGSAASRTGVLVATFGGEAPVAVTAAPATRRTMRLPDGTDVVLGPASRLRYEPRADGSRTVSLSGEAMFRVVHRAGRPFIVRVAGATLQDIGTVFVVRAYAGSPVQVSVQTGQVGVRATGSDGAMTTLEPGASATLDRAAGRDPTVVHDTADVGDAFAWTRGSLRYRATPLAEVTADLERAYDLDIRLADSTLGGRVVRYAVDGENADDALDVLVTALAGVRYERHGRVVTLYRR
jgi:ferric-dicitrate binding protein FerR (iron transport regulator)